MSSRRELFRRLGGHPPTRPPPRPAPRLPPRPPT
ncbi:hypothetical protein RMR41_18450, partial [Pseudomonas aeruginosa]|nr:hypothetical protein [Pseudomonas aeruginosa]